jgi:hypothetical protein
MQTEHNKVKCVLTSVYTHTGDFISAIWMEFHQNDKVQRKQS